MFDFSAITDFLLNICAVNIAVAQVESISEYFLSKGALCKFLIGIDGTIPVVATIIGVGIFLEKSQILFALSA